MDNFAQLYKNCETRIDLLLSSVGLDGEITDIKNNLLLSMYLDFVGRVFSTPENKKISDKLSSLNGNISFEDFEKTINESRANIEQNPVVIEAALKDSTCSVLVDFITELEPKLTAEKTAELRKLITP